MVSFNIKLAEISIRIRVLYYSTMAFCYQYITEESPCFEITITQSDIDEERELSSLNDIREGKKIVKYKDAYLEKLVLYRRIADKLFDYNILLCHGAVIALHNKAYLFTAESGTGKTTHAQLWLKNISGCHILNGDKPLLMFKENSVFVCGTPWQGKENFGRNEILPLEAVCILERSPKNHIVPISYASALEILLSQVHHPDENTSLVKIMKLFVQLSKIKLYRLGCNMESAASEVAYHGMVQEDPT